MSLTKSTKMRKKRLVKVLFFGLILTGCLFVGEKESKKLPDGWYLAYEHNDDNNTNHHYGFLDDGHFYLATYYGELNENSTVRWLYGSWKENPSKSEIVIHLFGKGKTDLSVIDINSWQSDFTLYKSMDTVLTFELVDSSSNYYLKKDQDLLRLNSKDFPLEFKVGSHNIVDLNMPENLTCEESLEWFDETNILDYSDVLNKVSSVVSKDYQNQAPWIPPATLQPDGTVAPPDTNNCDEGEQGQVSFPINCYSTILVRTSNKYIAVITIRDTKSNIVHRSTQWFGYCNELQNPNRINSDGMVYGWLVWNMKNEQGDYVKDGVYLWEVSFTNPDMSNTFVSHYVSGIIQSCSDENCYF